MEKTSNHFSKSVLKVIFLHSSNEISSVATTPNVGNPFTNTYPDWEEGTYNNFKEWAVRQFGLKELNSDDEAEVPVDMQKAKKIVFKKGKKGYYILPPMSEYKKIKQKQRVIRGYLGAVYSK